MQSPVDPEALSRRFPAPEIVDVRSAQAVEAEGPACSFDAFIARHALRDAALDRLATIVCGADTGSLALAPEAPGLLALSLGLSRVFDDDDAQLAAGLLMYDALYAWCRDACGETRWNPALRRAA